MREDIQKWVEALESGEYKQTRSCLKRKRADGTFGYCCLGVYADVTGLEVGKVWGSNVQVEDDDSMLHNKPTYLKIRNKIAEASGKIYGGDRVFAEGMQMNDDGKSFKQIAKMIRKEFKLND